MPSRLPLPLSLFLLLLLTACNDEAVTPVDNTDGEQYFPLVLNQPKFYAVDSITLFRVVSGIRYDTARLEARETLVETFTDAEGREWYRGERWERRDETQPWVFRQTYAVSRDDGAALRREDNLTFTKLIFPVRSGRRWDGHAAFDDSRELVVGGEFLDVYAMWNYRYGNVDTLRTLSTGLALPSVARVDQADTDNLIDYRQAYEIYAPGLGLVERFLDARHTQCRVCCNGDTGPCLDLPWDEKAEKGFILRQVLREN